jgi:hypothetical protein
MPSRFVFSRIVVLATAAAILIFDVSSHYVILVLPDDDSALGLGEKVLATLDPLERKQ